jgi:hypothetical protein
VILIAGILLSMLLGVGDLGLMAKLTIKEESFAQSIASGMNQSDAYRSAYNTAKMADKVLWKKASEVAARGKVEGRVKELKQELANVSLWSREKSVEVLADIAGGTEYKGTEKVSAVKELNAMHGFNEPIKIDHGSSDGSMSPKGRSLNDFYKDVPAKS